MEEVGAWIRLKKVQFVCDVEIDEMLHPETVRKIFETPGAIQTIKLDEFKVIETTFSTDNPEYATVVLKPSGRLTIS